MTGLDRRAFVKVGTAGAALLATPFVRGEGRLPILKDQAARAPGGVPVNWAQFRSEMKKRNQPGVIVLLLPLQQGAQQDQKKGKELAAVPFQQCQNDLATAVHNQLFSCGNSELPLLLVQAVFVAASPEAARKEFPSLPANAGLALIGVDGKVESTLPVDADMGKKFADRSAQLLYGKEGTLLAQRVKAERTALGEAACKKLDEALVNLDSDDFTLRQEASQHLNGLFGRIQAALAQAYRGAQSMEVRVRIDTLFRKNLHDQNTAALLTQSLSPYVAVADFGIRAKCGQGALRTQAHEFVQRWCVAHQG